MTQDPALLSVAAPSRFRFAARYALRHLGISLAVALLSAGVVFGLLYPAPYSEMLGIGTIFWLLLVVDVVCGPLLTLVLANPQKSCRERWVDFGLIGVIQLAALLYGLHSMWVARPVALVFEVDRLVVVTANQIDPERLSKAPASLRQLPWWGVVRAGTRRAVGREELMVSVERSLVGLSPSLQPEWWVPWAQAVDGAAQRAQPVTSLIARRPAAAEVLQKAIGATGFSADSLRYLPLTADKSLDWVALLDSQMNLVGYAPVDGF